MSARGRPFAPGVSGNPKGRPKKLRNAGGAPVSTVPTRVNEDLPRTFRPRDFLNSLKPRAAPADIAAAPPSEETVEVMTPEPEEMPPVIVSLPFGALAAKTADADARVQARRQKAMLTPYAPKRDPVGHFLPGQTGNPMGRPPSFSGYVRKMTSGGVELIDHAIMSLRGSVVVRWEDELTGEMRSRVVPVDARHQSEARAYLTEQGLIAPFDGRSRADESPEDLSRLSIEELRTYLLLNAKVSGHPIARVTVATAPTHPDEPIESPEEST